jgi:DnaJ-class molecular chaperone
LEKKPTSISKILVTCPNCNGHKGVTGKSSGPWVGAPATLPCPRCDGNGEVFFLSLTEEEKNPPPKKLHERDDF